MKNVNMVNERRQNFISLSELERGFKEFTSSESQGQIVGTRESLNGRKNIYGTKIVKNGEKSPWGQCLTRPVPNGRRRSTFWLGRKTQKFSGTNPSRVYIRLCKHGKRFLLLKYDIKKLTIRLHSKLKSSLEETKLNLYRCRMSFCSIDGLLDSNKVHC